jgi:hypothetical protein
MLKITGLAGVISKLAAKLILLGLLGLLGSPAFADLESVSLGNGYTAYDCGQPGSADNNACLNAMALGEAEFLAGYTPTGSPLPSDWQDLLPPLPGSGGPFPSVCYGFGAFAVSADGLSAVVLENFAGGGSCVEPEDAYPVAIWHDNAFIYTGPSISEIDICDGCDTRVAINDQGLLAAAGPEVQCGGYVEGLGCAIPYPSFGNWYPSSGLTLNDDNQVMFRGLSGGGLPDDILVDPAGAPIPGVPEPSSLALLATVLAVAIPRARKARSDSREVCDSSRRAASGGRHTGPGKNRYFWSISLAEIYDDNVTAPTRNRPMMIEFEDRSPENQQDLLAYLDREEQTSSRLTCPHCGAVNLFPWVPNVMAYTCRTCERAVESS